MIKKRPVRGVFAFSDNNKIMLKMDDKNLMDFFKVE
jgi:hypothetical protein